MSLSGHPAWPNVTANATSTYYFTGYNVSEPFPGTPLNSSEDDPWALEVSVTGDITGWNLDETPETYASWKAYRLGASASLTNDDDFKIDKSWSFCMTIFDGPSLTANQDEEIPEDCQGYLSDECLESLQQMAANGAQCSSSTIPDTCREDFGHDEDAGKTRDVWNQRTKLADGHVRDGLQNGERPSLIGVDWERHEPGNFTIYDHLIRQVSVVIFGFSKTLGERYGNTSVAAPSATLKCTRARVVPGVGNRELQDSFGSRAGPMWITGLVVLFSAMFLV